MRIADLFPPSGKFASLARLVTPQAVAADPWDANHDTARIDGIVHGDIRGAIVVIGKTGVVRGTIFADTAIVHGHVVGAIRAGSVELRASARVEGNIRQESLKIDQGAFFEGRCRYAREPLEETTGIVASLAEIRFRKPASSAGTAKDRARSAIP
jgi:hypothetical protein